MVQYGLVVRGYSVGLRRGAATHHSFAVQERWCDPTLPRYTKQSLV